METADREFLTAAEGFIDKAHQADQPFFVWFNTTRMHIWTHLAPGVAGKTGIGVYPDGMVEHDGMVGELLAELDRLGIANDTIVMYSTDNGAETMSWPDGGTTPFRGEKNTNWEGGYRVPTVIRWPGVIKPGTIHNEVFAHEDMLPTLLAAAGDPDVGAELRAGKRVGEQTYKVHLDGYDMAPFLKGDTAEPPRKEFLYWTDDGDLAALRYDQWKLDFREQRAVGFGVWEEPMVELRLPKLFTLRGDPFERADHEGIGYPRWRIDRAFMLVPAQAYIGQWLQSFVEFPPRMKAASFGIDQVMRQITQGPNTSD